VYAREMAHLKHNATLGLTLARRRAQAAGFDDALFVDADGLISEGSVWNLGLIQGETVVWPQAPQLAGTGMALIRRGLEGQGMATV
ncbi:aminotransferase class IV, partial [Pseudomonas sp. AH2 (2023)]|uniref:aminotransferase class IV n=1 Tax=Pseudomonas sp. AH2 (2023) TaxID=3048599 RepID=UPI002B239701